jgi:hypothetical protein
MLVTKAVRSAVPMTLSMDSQPSRSECCSAATMEQRFVSKAHHCARSEAIGRCMDCRARFGRSQ